MTVNEAVVRIIREFSKPSNDVQKFEEKAKGIIQQCIDAERERCAGIADEESSSYEIAKRIREGGAE